MAQLGPLAQLMANCLRYHDRLSIKTARVGEGWSPEENSVQTPPSLVGTLIPDTAWMSTRDPKMNPTVPAQRTHSPVEEPG